MTLELFQDAHRAADISPCGRYRYSLTRVWDPKRPRVAWVMLNPSTADARTDDPTIRRCIGFARSGGAGSIEVVNLYALRATDPAELEQALVASNGRDGRHNDSICAAARRSVMVIVAWGSHRAAYRWQRDREVMRLLRRREVYCLGTTLDGHPRHPLYLRADTKLQRFTLGGM